MKCHGKRFKCNEFLISLRNHDENLFFTINWQQFFNYNIKLTKKSLRKTCKNTEIVYQRNAEGIFLNGQRQFQDKTLSDIFRRGHEIVKVCSVQQYDLRFKLPTYYLVLIWK